MIIICSTINNSIESLGYVNLLGAFRVTLPAESSILFLIGVITASGIWFLSLTGVLSCLQNRFPERVLRGINILCGFVMLFYGGKLFWQFIKIIGIKL